jgi:hypothetical protein
VTEMQHWTPERDCASLKKVLVPTDELVKSQV